MAGEIEGFLKTLAKGELAPVYLLGGEEPLQLQEAGDALRARARELGFGEREVLDVEAHFDWDRLARSSASLSLFASRRLIELRLPTGKPDRDGSAAITEWCKAPAPDTVLLISAAEWSRKHEGAWVKAVERAGVYVWLRAPRLDQLPAWIRARMRAKGFAPDDDAVALLAARAEGNLLAIAQEIDKLAALRAGGPVGAEELEALGADNAVYDVFKLTDAAFGGDAARAVRILNGLRAEGEDVIPMLGWMLNQLDLALRLSSASDFASAARNEYGMWPARQQLFADALKRAGRGNAHWRRCLAECARIDRMAKGRETGDPWRGMERLVVAIAQPRTAATLLAA
ncbi:MAG: DNA polymerase III subunit delta [Xanthomonadales bacterium]|nr:DNA polymerase III subunit delta [Xanthomonadales bacterium]